MVTGQRAVEQTTDTEADTCLDRPLPYMYDVSSRSADFESRITARRPHVCLARPVGARLIVRMHDALVASRAACAAQRGFNEAVQLNATRKLAISCEPPEGSGLSAPCLHEHFFHFPKGFEHMNAEDMERSWRRVDPFNQCRTRKTDADWPTVELHHTRTSETKTMGDMMNLLGKRNVTIIGASLMRQTLGAMQCALETFGLRRHHELQWRHWGWSTFSSDNKGCGANFSRDLQPRTAAEVSRLRQAGCVPKGAEFAAMLSRSDVVVVGYNPQHYEGQLDWWRYDLEIMLPLLQAYAQQPGKLAVIREPPAQHFVGGAYDPQVKSFVSATRGCCVPVSPSTSHNNYNWHAVVAVHEMVARLAPAVRILPWYNETLRRHNAHIGTRAACFERTHDGLGIRHGTHHGNGRGRAASSGDGISGGGGQGRSGQLWFRDLVTGRREAASWTRRRECGCDCTHFCYTPLFWDATLLTPLHAMLLEADSGRAARRIEQHAESDSMQKTMAQSPQRHSQRQAQWYYKQGSRPSLAQQTPPQKQQSGDALRKKEHSQRRRLAKATQAWFESARRALLGDGHNVTVQAAVAVGAARGSRERTASLTTLVPAVEGKPGVLKKCSLVRTFFTRVGVLGFGALLYALYTWVRMRLGHDRRNFFEVMAMFVNLCAHQMVGGLLLLLYSIHQQGLDPIAWYSATFDFEFVFTMVFLLSTP